MEIWVNAIGTDKYLVSNLGNIKSLFTGKLLKKVTTSKGYDVVSIHRKQWKVHQLVYISFYGEYNKKELVIDHINRNRTDNRLINLRTVDFRTNAIQDPNKTSSKYPGVYKQIVNSKKGKKYEYWRAQIQNEKGVQEYLGLFKTEHEACIAYNSRLNGIKLCI